MVTQRFKNSAERKQKLEPEERKQHLYYTFVNEGNIIAIDTFCQRQNAVTSTLERVFHNYLKFLFQKFHLIVNTQLGVHRIFQTEREAELFSVKCQPLSLNVTCNINLTNQQITRVCTTFVRHHIFILQNVEWCSNERN